MVIAGVVIDSKYEKKLRAIGVKDSKELTPKRRTELAPKIEELCKTVIVLRVPACKIDSYRAKKINLDIIEAMRMAEIVNVCGAERIFIDSLEANPEKFKKRIQEYVTENGADLIVENYSDETYPVVSAASVIAKVERDKVIEEIKRKVNFDFGVGYSHDKRTINFVKKLIEEKKQLPPYVRQSWVTTQVLQEAFWQRKLKDFFKKREKCKEG
jgi:ribonuclease HII